MTLPIALVVHGHFYQPPRENPWSDELEREPSASPFHDWNQRIHSECYRANAFARIHDRAGRISAIVNNYQRMSFNFGPTLVRWMERYDLETHARLAAADAEQLGRLGSGGGVAQAYAHPILPLASPADRQTQVLWGLADFRRRFGRRAEGLWLPETAANAATLETLIEAGLTYTILAPEQVAAVRAPKAEWDSVDRDTVDTGRAYRWYHRDGSGRYLTVAVFDGPLSRAVAFSDATRDAASFVAAVNASGARTRTNQPPLVLCASDGELFGHHKKFADLSLAFLTFVEAEKHGITPTNLGAYLRAYPAEWEMALAEGPDGRGTAWSCAHGVGRWWRDCGCSMTGPEHGWNQKWRTPLRQATDRLNEVAADLFEDQGAQLLVDPWGARDAYGDVVDGSRAARLELIEHFATPKLLADGDAGRARALLLLEVERAVLMMYASCGWYFDDIAGLEAGLVLRLGAYAADLMTQAGAVVPTGEILDILASAKSNLPSGVTGADLFVRASGDRITHAHALAQVAFTLLSRSPTEARLDTLGHSVAISGTAVDAPPARPGTVAGITQVTGQARVTNQRTGVVVLLPFQAVWDPARGFSCQVGAGAGAEAVELSHLGLESRHVLLPLLLPQLEAEGEPLMAARVALDLGRGVVGTGDDPEDVASRRVYQRLFMRVLGALEGAEARPAGAAALDDARVELAIELLEAAGPALGPGTPERAKAEELVARLAHQLRVGPGASGKLAHLETRLGFAPAVDPLTIVGPPAKAR
jgi:hypothetical protein